MSTSDKRKCEKCGHRFVVPEGGDRWQCPKCGTRDFICDDTSTEPIPVISAFPEALRDAHPRDVVCNKAGMELWEFVNEWSSRHGLTFVEKANMLNTILLIWTSEEDGELAERVMDVRELLVRIGKAEREGKIT